MKVCTCLLSVRVARSCPPHHAEQPARQTSIRVSCDVSFEGCVSLLAHAIGSAWVKLFDDLVRQKECPCIGVCTLEVLFGVAVASVQCAGVAGGAPLLPHAFSIVTDRFPVEVGVELFAIHSLGRRQPHECVPADHPLRRVTSPPVTQLSHFRYRLIQRAAAAVDWVTLVINEGEIRFLGGNHKWLRLKEAGLGDVSLHRDWDLVLPCFVPGEETGAAFLAASLSVAFLQLTGGARCMLRIRVGQVDQDSG
mmetsp:Transcript_29455/g.73343  ORF Transcript_29455/g.73343 Transcript_29455/m.73343 type:complete len:251 (+) Transcript_29455:345-1097(+)